VGGWDRTRRWRGRGCESEKKCVSADTGEEGRRETRKGQEGGEREWLAPGRGRRVYAWVRLHKKGRHLSHWNDGFFSTGRGGNGQENLWGRGEAGSASRSGLDLEGRRRSRRS